MDRRNPTQHGPFVILVTCVIVVSVAVMGVAQVSAETDGRQPLTITNSGDAENLFSYENEHTVSNIEIGAGGETPSNEYLTFYINFIELQDANINVSNVSIQNSSVVNGEIMSVSTVGNTEQLTLAIHIKQLDTSDPIQIDSVQLDGFDTSNGDMANNIQYRIGAINTNSTTDYDYLEEGGYTRNTTAFDFINAHVTVSDQATASTSFHKTSRTSSGVTVSNFDSNTNSTIILTNKENSKIVGYSSQREQGVIKKDNISLNTSILGGDIGVYIIPNNRIGTRQNVMHTELSDKQKQFSIAKDRFWVYLGTVQFSDQEYETGRVTNLSVTTSEVRDTAGMDTPYIVSIHPVTADGEVINEDYIGYSDVLIGVNDDTTIPIRNARRNKSAIWHSSRFVATIRLAQGQKVGEPVDLNSTSLLPNSDIKKQFVEGGVSDSADIHISNVHSDQNNSDDIDHIYHKNEYNGKRVYSGDLTGLENRTQSQGPVRLHRITEDNQSVVVGLGTYSNSTDRVLFNTTGLQTGTYAFSGHELEREDQFKLIGKKKRRVDFTDDKNKINSGMNIESELHYNTPEMGVRISDSDTDKTLLTANLSTPTPGRTSIGLNTYAFGNESLTDDLLTTGPNATVESVDAAIPNETPPLGEYRIEVRSEQGLATAADEATVVVGNRSTNGMRAYATTDLDRDDLGTADAVRGAIEAGTLSPTSTVTSNETVVYVVNATGLTGLPAARNATLGTGADLAGLDGLAFDVRSNASATATGDGRSAPNDATPRNSSVHVDEDGLYLVAGGDDALATDGTPADGETFTAEFHVEDGRLRETASDPTSDHAASTTVTFEAPPSNEGDTDPVGDDPPREGDSQPDNGGTGGGSGGGTGGGSGGGTGGGSGSGTAAGGSGTGTGGGNAGDGGATGETTGAGSTPTRPETGERGDDDGETRVDREGNGGRHGIQRVAGLRPTGRDGPIRSPVAVSPAGTGAAESGAESSRGSAPRGDERFDDADAGGETASGPNEAGPRATGDTAAESDTGAAERATPDYEDAPIRTTADDVPGFGPVVTLVALLLAAKVAARRRRPER